MNISVVQNWSDFGWPSCICQYCACLAIMSNRVCKRRFVVQFPHRTGGTSENLEEGAKSKTRSFDGPVCASDLAKIWWGFGATLPPSPFLPCSAGPTSYIDRFNSRSFLIEDDYYTAYHKVSYPFNFILCKGNFSHERFVLSSLILFCLYLSF